MATKLDKLLDQIHPKRTLDEVQGRVDRAVNRFQGAKGKVTDIEAYRELVGRFYAHVEAEALGMKAPMYDGYANMHWGRATELLNQAWGPEGWKVGFEMARTGVEGGFRQVLNTLAERMALMYARNEIQARVYDYWKALSTQEKLAAADEYLDEYGHLLPGELTEGSAVRVRVNLPEVLIEHPFLMRRLGKLGR